MVFQNKYVFLFTGYINIIIYLTINTIKATNNNKPKNDKSIFNLTVIAPKIKNKINTIKTDNNADIISLTLKYLVKLLTIKPFNILKIVK